MERPPNIDDSTVEERREYIKKDFPVLRIVICADYAKCFMVRMGRMLIMNSKEAEIINEERKIQ